MRSPKEHMNTRILCSGWKAVEKGDSRNHGLWDLYVFEVFGVPKYPGAC